MNTANHNAQPENGLPAGWVWTTLGQVSIAQSGVGFPKDFQGKVAGDYPFVKVGDVSRSVLDAHGVLATAGNFLDRVEAEKLRAKVFPPGTTLFAKIGEALKLNRRAIAAVDLLADNNVMGLIPDGTIILNRYLYYYMLTVDLGGYTQATTVPSVRKSDIELIAIPLAPLPEQHRIVAEIETQFSRLDAGVAALKRAQGNLRRYKASVLKAACQGRLVPTEAELARGDGRAYESGAALLARILAERRARWEQANPGKRYVEPKWVDADGLAELPEGWMWASMEQIMINFRSGSTAVPQDIVTDYPILRSSSVRPMFLDLSDVRYLHEGMAFSVDNFIEVGDLLFTRLSGSLDYVGNCALVRTIMDRRIQYPDRIFRAKLCEQELCRYVEMYFASSPVRKQITAKAKSTAGHQRISMGAIQNQPVALPPLVEQHRIVAEVERRLSVAQEVEGVVAASLRRAERLRQSILKRGFEGRL